MAKTIVLLVFCLLVRPPAWAADPVGYFDGANCTHMWGWTCDADSPNAQLDVHLYADGPSGVGAFIGSTKANTYRPDVPQSGMCPGTLGAYHGFDISTSPLVKLGDQHIIYAYAINVGAGTTPALVWSGTARTTLTCPRERARVGLNYFGFAGQGGNLTYQSETRVNTSSAISYTNAIHFGPNVTNFPNNAYVGNYLNDMRNRGAFAILGLHDIFFCSPNLSPTDPRACSSSQTKCPPDPTPQNPNPDPSLCPNKKRLSIPGKPIQYRDIWRLHSNWSTRWSQFVSLNSAYVGNPGYVASFYIADEPTLNGITPAALTTVTNQLATQYPSIPRSIVESYAIIDRKDVTWPQLVIPTQMTWVGFDDYGWRPLQNNPPRNPLYTTTLQTLKSLRTSAGQKILLVADTWWNPSSPYGDHLALANNIANSNDPTVMGGVAIDYYNLARQDSSIVAIVGFLYPRLGKYGARDLIGKGSFVPPEVPPASWSTNVINNTYRLIGRSIAGDR